MNLCLDATNFFSRISCTIIQTLMKSFTASRFSDQKDGFRQILSDPHWFAKVMLGGFLLINPFLVALAPSYFSGQGPGWVQAVFPWILGFNVLSFWFPLGFTFEVLRRARTGCGIQLPDWQVEQAGCLREGGRGQAHARGHDAAAPGRALDGRHLRLLHLSAGPARDAFSPCSSRRSCFSSFPSAASPAAAGWMARRWRVARLTTRKTSGSSAGVGKITSLPRPSSSGSTRLPLPFFIPSPSARSSDFAWSIPGSAPSMPNRLPGR